MNHELQIEPSKFYQQFSPLEQVTPDDDDDYMYPPREQSAVYKQKIKKKDGILQRGMTNCKENYRYYYGKIKGTLTPRTMTHAK